MEVLAGLPARARLAPRVTRQMRQAANLPLMLSRSIGLNNRDCLWSSLGLGLLLEGGQQTWVLQHQVLFGGCFNSPSTSPSSSPCRAYCSTAMASSSAGPMAAGRRGRTCFLLFGFLLLLHQYLLLAAHVNGCRCDHFVIPPRRAGTLWNVFSMSNAKNTGVPPALRISTASATESPGQHDSFPLGT